MSRMVMTTVYLDPDQHEALGELSRRTRVSRGEYVRQGIDMLLAETDLLAFVKAKLAEAEANVAAEREARQVTRAMMDEPHDL